MQAIELQVVSSLLATLENDLKLSLVPIEFELNQNLGVAMSNSYASGASQALEIHISDREIRVSAESLLFRQLCAMFANVANVEQNEGQKYIKLNVGFYICVIDQLKHK